MPGRRGAPSGRTRSALHREGEGQHARRPGLAEQARADGERPAGVGDVVDEQDRSGHAVQTRPELGPDCESPPDVGQPEGAVAAGLTDRAAVDEVEGTQMGESAQLGQSGGE